MELIIGKHAGFCFGVQRAVEQAYIAGSKGPCASLGPLIHNPQEVERLRRAGVRTVTNPADVRPGETLIIRSHGVSQEVMKTVEQMNVPLLDLTCPHVAHIHELVMRSEDPVIIIGEADHPEVQGIAGWARKVMILSSVEEALSAELPSRVVVVAQTTLRRERFDEVLSILRERVAELTVHMTICGATSQRQQEARQLAANADAVIVVGGRNSSNTCKLLETCRAGCPRSILVETGADLPEGFVTEADRVVVTGGASTPHWLLDDICERIRASATIPAERRRDDTLCNVSPDLTGEDT